MEEKLFWMQVFAGEGGGGAEGAGNADGQAAGMQAGAETAENAEDAARRQAFEKAITDNKDLYEERLRAQLDRRMKGAQRDMDLLKGQNARYNGLAQAIAQRYGIDATDMDGLEKAVREDQSWLEEQAAKNGLTLEQQRHINELEAKNREFEAARQAAERQAEKDKIQAQWMQEAEALKQTFPDFDLATEAQNKDFIDLISKNVPMEMAYKLVHQDEILSGAIQYAVQRTADNVAASVRANGLRPTEGAGRGSAPASAHFDVNNMTREQREELKRRALRGERVTL